MDYQCWGRRRQRRRRQQRQGARFAEQELAQEQVREAERLRQLAEKQRLEKKNDLDLGM